MNAFKYVGYYFGHDYYGIAKCFASDVEGFIEQELLDAKLTHVDSSFTVVRKALLVHVRKEHEAIKWTIVKLKNMTMSQSKAVYLMDSLTSLTEATAELLKDKDSTKKED